MTPKNKDYYKDMAIIIERYTLAWKDGWKTKDQCHRMMHEIRSLVDMALESGAFASFNIIGDLELCRRCSGLIRKLREEGAGLKDDDEEEEQQEEEDLT